MEETTFAADPMRLMIAAAVGIVVLLVLIIKFKLHPVLSMMISAIIIGAGAGMPLTMISDTVEKGVGKTLQGIALLVGLGSMFGGILEVSGGAQRIAETLIGKFGQKKAGWALGLTGLVIGTTVFFEAGVVVLIPLVFSVAKQTRKSTLYYAIPLLSGLASGYAFVPPSAGSVLVANALGVNLGTMIMVGVPTALICMMVSGIFWGSFIGNKIHTELPANVEEIKDDGKDLPPFGLVLGVILIPLVLILLSTLSKYIVLSSCTNAINAVSPSHNMQDTRSIIELFVSISPKSMELPIKVPMPPPNRIPKGPPSIPIKAPISPPLMVSSLVFIPVSNSSSSCTLLPIFLTIAI